MAESLKPDTPAITVTEEEEAEEAKSDVGDMGTLFILDLMRQRREKVMRKKKDDLINELAMKKKEQMMEARMGRRVLMRPAYGGFAGVNAILAGSKCNSPAPSRRRTPKPEERPPNVDIPPPERTDLLIMGMIRDQREEKFHEAHNVSLKNVSNLTPYDPNFFYPIWILGQDGTSRSS